MSRLKSAIAIALLLVAVLITLALLGPVVTMSEGDRGGIGTYRTYWGILGPLRVTTRVESFGVDEVTRYREWDWNAATLAISLAIIVMMWGLFWLLARRWRRLAKPQA